MDDKIKAQNELLDLFAKTLKEKIIQIMKATLDKTITDQEAENMLCNVGLHIMNKNKDLITN